MFLLERGKDILTIAYLDVKKHHITLTELGISILDRYPEIEYSMRLLAEIFFEKIETAKIRFTLHLEIQTRYVRKSFWKHWEICFHLIEIY